MLKKFLLIISFLVSSTFAQISQSAAISAVQANPALLNTPEAKALMSEKGINKSEVLSKIAATKSKGEDKTTVTKAKNNLSKTNSLDLKKEKFNIKKNGNNNVFMNPLRYKGNNQILKDLRVKQSIKRTKKLSRYGINFFKNRNSLDVSSLPVPSYYILSNKDVVSIWIYGAKNENFSLKIDNKGDINIPKYGPLHIAGLQFDEVQKYIKKKLKKVYPNINIVINIKNYSTIQVNLVGDVVAPGVFNINSLSTIKNLLIASGGVKPTGSLRNVILKRNRKIIATIDFYKLLQNGDDGMNIILRSNDTVFIPKADKIVSIDGEVNNPAKFELKPNETLDNLLKYAGGIKSSASKFGFVVKRYVKNEKLKTIEVDLKDAKKFKLLNDDKIYVYKIDKIHKESIYLYGNLVRPGERELNKSRSLRELLKNEISKLSLKGVFLDDTLFSYALLKRKTNSLDKKIENFNLADVLNGKSDVKLKNDDEIYIFNQYNSNLTPYVIISGTPIIKPGKYRYYKNIKIPDLIAIAGTAAYFKNFNKIKVTTYHTKDFMPKTTVISGKIAENYKLYPFDQIKVYDYYKQNHIKKVNISGEVNIPNSYILNKNMTLKQLIETAGGFTQKAYKKEFEVVRYFIKNDKREKKIIEVNFKDLDKFVLKNYDEVNIHKIPNWNNRRTVNIKGEVNFPGTYVISAGDTLDDLIKRAGGYTQNAFLRGAIFTRKSIKVLQRKSQKEAIIELRQKALALSSSPNKVGEGNKKIDLISITNMIDKISAEAQKLQPIGRVSIKLDNNLTKFKTSKSNLILKDKDALMIPSKNDTILVMGEVMSPTAVVYESNDVNYYIQKAGSFGPRADKDGVFVVHADGSAQRVEEGWFSGQSSHIIKRGDTIIVPQKLITYTNMQIAKDVSSIFYNFALTAAAMSAVGAL